MKSSATDRPRFGFLDGLRGVASLYVLVHHIVLVAGDKLAALAPWTGWTRHGTWAVSLFIVLSGYCLTLPLVQHGLRLKDGFRGFILRRAQRILPPYYAALVLACGANWIFREAYWYAGDDPAITPASTVAHIFLYHNLQATWIYDLNGAFWSIATEWHIYLLFALVILPIWRRIGVLAGLIFSLLLGWCLGKLTGQSLAVYFFVGLFGFGQAAAMWTVAAPAWLRRIPVGSVTAGVAILLLYLAVFFPEVLQRRLSVELTLVGLVAAGFILHCAQSARRGWAVLWVRMLESSPVLALGKISYSLYLVHAPVLVVTQWFFLPLQPSAAAISAYLFGSFALSLGLAVGFFIAFERPWLKARFRVAPVQSRVAQVAS